MAVMDKNNRAMKTFYCSTSHKYFTYPCMPDASANYCKSTVLSCRVGSCARFITTIIILGLMLTERHFIILS